MRFFKEAIKFQGQIAAKDGLRTNPGKTEAEGAWLTPTNATELRSFLGSATYFRRFVRGYAHLASPVNNLTETSCLWPWSMVCGEAFDELKANLVSASVLAFPDVSKGNPPFILDTDASDRAIGFVWSQVQPDGLKH